VGLGTLGIMPDAAQGRPGPPHLRCVFVYGTLRAGQANHITRLAPAPRLLGTARVYHLGGYPGLVLGGAGWVHGEVYAVRPALEVRLDEIEMIYPPQSDEYTKRQLRVEVALVAGGRAELSCLCYAYNPAHLQGAPRIPSGDWVNREGEAGP
jgi:gamma-glutamylcyclotransferase (GGCT)/AIG2-like uncharacterized protein YtfP